MEATRQSLKPLKGEAAHVAMQLGPKTTISNLLDKFGSIYSMAEVREHAHVKGKMKPF